MKRVMSWLRHAPDRLLHPVRRRRALDHLRAVTPPRGVLFVCLGNICRSPYAEVAFRASIPEELRGTVRVRSAGFLESGRPSPETAVEVASSMGHDLTGHRSTGLTPDSVRASELILVMEAAQKRRLLRLHPSARGRVVVLGDLDPEPIRKRTILDPVDRGAPTFERVYARIDRCLDSMVLGLGWS